MRPSSIAVAKGFSLRGHTQPARKTLLTSISVVLSVLLIISGIPGGFLPAVAAGDTGAFTWDTRADFENNASTTDETTTISGVSTEQMPGSGTLPGPIVAIAAGEVHTVGLNSDGTVVATGDNTFGQLDVTGWTDVVSVSAGYHTVGLKSDGTVVAVGRNIEGQLGVSGWTDIVSVSAGFFHTVGLKSDGTVVAVGFNGDGQTDVSGWTDIVSVAAGPSTTFGLKADGTVVAVGYNDYGQTNVSGWTDIVAIAAGAYHTVGLKSDGTVVAVGDNSSGQKNVSGWTNIVSLSASYYDTVGRKSDGTVVAVGDNSHGQTDVTSWADIVAVAAGTAHMVALKADGTTLAIGYNYSGQTDVSDWDDYVSATAGGWSTFGLKSDGTVVPVGSNYYGETDVSGWTDIVSVAAGLVHTVGLKPDGTVVAVGYDSYGQTDVSGWTDIVSVAAGHYHTVGIKADRSVVATGYNDSGQTDVSGWTDIVSAAAGYRHTVGLKSDGTVVAVGDNSSGQTGVSGWTDIVAVAAGEEHTVGLKSDGTVVAVGYNGNGQTGVSGWTNIVSVTCGRSYTVGLKADGTVVAVGDNTYGQTDVSGWTDVVSVSARYTHTVGLKADGTVAAVGASGEGELNVSSWTSLTGDTPRSGLIGGTGSAVGLRAQAPRRVRWASIEATTSLLRPLEAVKFAVRTSDDGVTWSAPLGYEGDPIDWTTGTGNYLGRAVTDASERTDLGWALASEYIDIVARLESAGPLTPELKSVTLTYEINDAPVANNDAYETDEDTQLVVTGASGVLSNDSDAEGDPFGAVLVGNVAHGTLAALAANGGFTYTPAPDFHGTDTFTYQAYDALGFSNEATVTITVTDVSDLPPGVTRVEGANRYKTCVEASERAFPDGAGTVVIATGANWPDALGGSALAGAVDGPLLLTATNALPAEVTAEIARLKAKSVYILGGPSAVGTGVENALKTSLGSSNVTRLAGDSRYTTARTVADEVIALAGPGYDGVAYVATGGNFPDALGVSPIAAARVRPILLADPRSGAVSRPGAVDEVYILGSTNAVGTPVEAALKAALGTGNVHRLQGGNRYATAVAVANHGIAEGLSWDGVGIATGTNFPDGLSGGAMLGRLGTVMLLTPSTILAPETRTALQSNAGSIDCVFILGGTPAISPGVFDAVCAATGL